MKTECRTPTPCGFSDKLVALFREQIKALGLTEKPFARFHEQLAAQDYTARAGQMTERIGDKPVAATFVEIPRQRNTYIVRILYCSVKTVGALPQNFLGLTEPY